jgi:hypothetical protein
MRRGRQAVILSEARDLAVQPGPLLDPSGPSLRPGRQFSQSLLDLRVVQRRGGRLAVGGG